MAGRSGRYGPGACALALTLAYTLVLQLLLASVFAASAIGTPLAAAGSTICLSAASSAPTDEHGGGRAVFHCPLCTLRLDLALPPPVMAEGAIERPAFPVLWSPAPAAVPAAPPARTANRPRGPPMVPFLA